MSHNIVRSDLSAILVLMLVCVLHVSSPGMSIYVANMTDTACSCMPECVTTSVQPPHMHIHHTVSAQQKGHSTAVRNVLSKYCRHVLSPMTGVLDVLRTTY
jgi:hypothetical protein